MLHHELSVQENPERIGSIDLSRGKFLAFHLQGKWRGKILGFKN
jgi:hypothetical protein